MADATATRAPRTTPSEGTVVDGIPGSNRQGFWAAEFEWFQTNPLTVKRYEGVSPTTASYLRSTYGLDAHSRNSRNGKCDLYVQYNPETAEALKNRPKKPRKSTAKAAAK